MTESSIFDPGHSQHPKPGMEKKPTAGRTALAFNPLHPSMELPPEQLIRLLGMESKKTRKHMKIPRSSSRQESRRAVKEQKTQRSPDQQSSRCATDEQQPQGAQDDRQQSQRVADRQKAQPSPNQASRLKTIDKQERPEPQQVAGSNRHMQYERNEPAVFEQRGPWLLPALAIGLVAGVAVSGYLFWYQPTPAAKQKTPAPVVSSESQNRRMPKQQPNNQQIKHKAAADGGKTATLPASAPAKAARTGNDAKWQAAIKTEQNRLRSTAEQRLTEQLTKIKVNRELADLQAPPANDNTAAEPAFDQAAMSEPAAASAESPPTQEAPVEMTQIDEASSVPEPEPETLPAVTPDQGVGSDRNGEMLEESADLVDSFEQDVTSDVAATIAEDTLSNIAPSLDVNTTSAFTRSNERDSVSDVAPSSGDEMETEQTSVVSDESSSSASEDPASF